VSRRAPASPPLGLELLRQQLAELSATSTPSDVALLVRRHPALLAPQAIGAATADSEALGWRVDGLRQVAGSGAAGGLPLSPGRRVRVRNPLAMARHTELVDRFVLLHERGRVEDAAPRAPEVVELAREAYGEQSTEYGVQLLNAAVVHAADQDWAAADRTFSAATDVLVADHPALLPGAAASIANAMAGASRRTRWRCTSSRGSWLSGCRVSSMRSPSPGCSGESGTR
jgi:hypothetical protein